MRSGEVLMIRSKSAQEGIEEEENSLMGVRRCGYLGKKKGHAAICV